MSILIKDIQRNSNEIIRIEVSEFKGKELINIRIWYVAGRDMDGNDVYKPTQKGVALNISEFSELRDGILKLEEYIKDKAGDAVPEQPAPVHKADYSEGIPDQEEEKADEDENS
ncbi:MAG TPA: transcriptional coactivator p15/PC4 family protein [Spirochaetota bacterium]|nr:transcriptional coactivator p15/PC4 family protein [Spirochaetota bacterium]HPJ33267.1 transcriptional coactivator p15/PC4 family protein [Spirochaetota bacterium]